MHLTSKITNIGNDQLGIYIPNKVVDELDLTQGLMFVWEDLRTASGGPYDRMCRGGKFHIVRERPKPKLTTCVACESITSKDTSSWYRNTEGEPVCPWCVARRANETMGLEVVPAAGDYL